MYIQCHHGYNWLPSWQGEGHHQIKRWIGSIHGSQFSGFYGARIIIALRIPRTLQWKGLFEPVWRRGRVLKIASFEGPMILRLIKKKHQLWARIISFRKNYTTKCSLIFWVLGDVYLDSQPLVPKQNSNLWYAFWSSKKLKLFESCTLCGGIGFKNKNLPISLGILAHLLRMVSWNLNTFCFGGVIVHPFIILWQWWLDP